MSSSPLRCVLVGGGSLLIRCAECLLERGHSLAAVVSDEPEICAWAEAAGHRRLDPRGDLVRELEGQPFEYLFSIANMQILPDEVVAVPLRAALNFHDGPLPEYAGLYVTSWALLHREPRHAVVWHRMDRGVDRGAVLARRDLGMDPQETAFTLNARCYEAGLESFEELLPALEAGRDAGEAQPAGRRRLYTRRRRPEAVGTLRFDQEAAALEAVVRALDFGSYPNPLCRAKLALADRLLVVTDARALPDSGGAEPGTVLARDAHALRVAAGTGSLEIRGLASLAGRPLPIGELADSLAVGSRLPRIDRERARSLRERHEMLAPHEAFWSRRLGQLAVPELPYAGSAATGSKGAGSEGARELATRSFESAVGLSALGGAELCAGERLLALFGVYLGRLCGREALDLGFQDARLAASRSGFEDYLAESLPLRISARRELGFPEAARALRDELQTLRGVGSYARDLVGRRPELAKAGDALRLPVQFALCAEPSALRPPPGAELLLAVTPGADVAVWHYDPSVYEPAALEGMERQLRALFDSVARDPHAAIARHALLPSTERQRLLVGWNDTRRALPPLRCIHHAIEARLAQSPGSVALRFEDRSLDAGTLNSEANRLARHLRSLGVGPGVRVGVALERSLELVVALLAIHKAGGAYLPLDPAYPEERLTFMIEDAQAAVLITRSDQLASLPAGQARLVRMDTDAARWASESGLNLEGGSDSDDPAYVIYTSGSTGKPKGVPVAHRNVLNFFAGMDEVIGAEPPGVWLALTSLSFDISVLELLWTLARGFEVVIHAPERSPVAAAATRLPHADRPMALSLFYFASDESQAEEKYRLLLEGARFADSHGFEAVWTPERHFHAFGGLYPNAAVTGAAVAAVTRRVAVRAGSCVVPLHQPIRIAEEWAVVDNLSGGRAGVSIASGWQPNDFALRPDAYADAKQRMFREIETVRKLWRGETVEFPGPRGEPVPVRTLPRPIQPELPVWVTAAGNPETFREAGERGFNMLTHLLGQSVEEVAEKIRIYREAWERAGHAGRGQVTLMLHTFIGDDEARVRELVREPLKQYLKSSVNLVKEYASSWPTFTQMSEKDDAAVGGFLENLSEEDMDALLEHSFERYYATSGLLGTPEQGLALLDRLKGHGVDEVACLIDFGVEPETVLAHLEPLARLREACQPPAEGLGDHRIPAQLQRHGVTHLQCTPSQATLLLQDPEARAGLAGLRCWLVGGEALPAALASELCAALPGGRAINVYGPTETTIWSASWELRPGEAPAIGRPIANTELYVVNEQLDLVPVGVPGELLIGGAGVVGGYLDRPELSAERFVPHPFRDDPTARVYRTGDLVRYRPDGNLEFLGRIDHQVKIRGHRIELGEIEARLAAMPEVREAVVLAREDAPGDLRLVAYWVAAEAPLPAETLRARLREVLPDVMVPAHYVALDTFPLTPNAKIDRRALPAPEASVAPTGAASAPPSSALETAIAGIWCEVLGRSGVGIDDNFFDLGGHSMLTIRVLARLRDETGRQLPMTDLFRFPTVRTLAAHLSGDAAPSRSDQGRDRGAERRRALQHRRTQRKRRGESQDG